MSLLSKLFKKGSKIKEEAKKDVKINKEREVTSIKKDTQKIDKDMKNDDYETIKIGNQEWMAKNLNVCHFRNGESIPEAKSNEEWKKAGASKQPVWCNYDNEISNGKKYGKLYNGYAVNDPRGLAPEGWGIPSDEEWIQLVDYLGGEDVAGTKMKSTSGWSDNGNDTNKSGFSGLRGGYRNFGGNFYNIGYFGSGWWSSTEGGDDGARSCSLSLNGPEIDRSVLGKGNGFSVRCLKDI